MASVWMGAWRPEQALPAAFVELPQQVYAEHPAWLGEDPQALARQFSPANPWFASGQAWLGVEPGLARLAGFFNGQVVDGETVAFFGFWETLEDPAANQRLFQGLRDWAHGLGATRLYGPINFTTFGNYRLRLDQFEAGCFAGEPFNPPYYPGLLEGLGLDLRHRYLSTFNQTGQIAASVGPDYMRVRPELQRLVSLEPLDGAFWMAHLDELYPFVDQVFGANFAYTPLSRQAFEQQCGQGLADRLCPHSSVLARAKDGRIAGFFLAYPDYGPLLRRDSPQQVSANSLSHAAHYPLLPTPRQLLAKTGGVHPDFRQHGLFTAMGSEVVLRAAPHYQRIVGAMVREDNNSRQFALRHSGGDLHHYGLYGGSL
ncbi:MAG: hypothetical protein ABWY06_01320 [Pseudomonas sp.]|uniref:hypothetical protein n=1 Tax=Pseudomonas sp. TaxID=306 RepID=UPI0033933208